MIPKQTHQVWLGPEMPKEFQCWRNHIKALHPTWKHYLWTAENVHEIGLQPDDYAHSTYAGSSNIIRLAALKKLGGFYLDLDIELLKPLTSLTSAFEVVCRQKDGPLCNAFIGARANSPWIEHQLLNLQDFQEHDAAHACHVMTEAPSKTLMTLSPEIMFPWNWDEEPDYFKITPTTMGIHWWAKSWCL